MYFNCTFFTIIMYVCLCSNFYVDILCMCQYDVYTLWSQTNDSDSDSVKVKGFDTLCIFAPHDIF